MKTNSKPSAVQTLAFVSKGYATDAQIDSALKEAEATEKLLKESLAAMLQMESMLRKHADISIQGGSIAKTIETLKGVVA